MTTEFFISFALIMMMLSLVSERVSNLIKLYFQNKEIYIPFISKKEGIKAINWKFWKKDSKFREQNWKFWKNWTYYIKVKLVILAYKQPTEMAEKEREYRLMIINILTGITIACLANANFFEIVKQISQSNNDTSINIKGILDNGFNASIVIGGIYFLFFIWSVSLILFSRLQELDDKINKSKYKYPFLFWLGFTVVILLILQIKFLGCPLNYHLSFNFISIVRHTVGFTITGLFLSLGSKFWHDLLDILFKFKNTQQVLANPDTYKNYDSPDKLIALVETPAYEIPERLYALYKDKIAAINGVVSHGLHTVLDERTKLYKKIIEVEITNPAAQGELDKIKYSGSVQIKLNDFFLKDYLFYKRTSNLVAVSSIDSSPVCYAFNANPANTSPTRGSFSVYKDGDKYFASSNLHVFADDIEFKNFEDNPNHKLINKTVQFVIGNDTSQTGEIIDYKFGQYDSYGFDFCICKINKALYDLFLKKIDVNRLISIDEYTMSMYGALTKYVTFHPFRSPTTCYVEYNGFNNKKELYLFKIALSTPGIVNISKGDSGSTVYYKIKENNITLLATGIIVAKSDDYAYIFRGKPLINSNTLES